MKQLKITRNNFLVNLLNLYKVFDFSNKNYLGNESDTAKMKKDWKAVGGDISWSMDKIQLMEPKMKMLK